MTEISPSELAERLRNDEDITIVDIRSPEDHETDGIDGSQNVPVREALLTGDTDSARDQLNDLSEDEEIVTVCDAGHASGETARLLREQGYDAKVLDGGLQAWKKNEDE